MTRRPPDERDDAEYDAYGDEEYADDFPVAAEPAPPPARPPRPRATAAPPAYGPPGRARPPRQRPPAYMPPPPARPPNWQNVALGFMGAALLGMLGLLVFLVMQRNAPAPAPGAAPTLPALGNGGAATNPPAASSSDPPRMSLETFKKLYDDPAQRPPIFDVRAADVYAQGHIAGARSLPEAEADTRYSEVPKDKLVILYCQ